MDFEKQLLCIYSVLGQVHIRLFSIRSNRHKKQTYKLQNGKSRKTKYFHLNRITYVTTDFLAQSFLFPAKSFKIQNAIKKIKKNLLQNINKTAYKLSMYKSATRIKSAFILGKIPYLIS